jgi:hypothetical protein
LNILGLFALDSTHAMLYKGPPMAKIGLSPFFLEARPLRALTFNQLAIIFLFTNCPWGSKSPPKEVFIYPQETGAVYFFTHFCPFKKNY